jgi:hypothetical protein
MIVAFASAIALCIAALVAVMQRQVVAIDRHYAARCRELARRVTVLEAMLEPTDVDDDEGGIEYEDIHPAIQARVREILVAKGFKQNGADA